MPKITWQGDADERLTADDIEEAEEGFQQYTGDLPRGGVYRFKLRRMKFKTASTGTQGLGMLLILDGTWKREHAQYDGCPLWDDVWMTKGSAAFVKALARALGVSGADLVGKVITNDDDIVTKIGRKTIIDQDLPVYVAVRHGSYNEVPRLEKAGTGFQVVDAEEEAQPPATSNGAKAKPVKAAKGKGKKNKDDDPPF